MGRGVEKLHPELQIIVNKFLIQCKNAGLNVLITETFRTKEEQETLYAQGRTKPGNVVTNCKYPQSPHCWGVAFDFCRNLKGKEYSDSDGFFKKVGNIGKQFGLTWGGDWTGFIDKPHLELTKYMPNASYKWLVNTYGTPEKFKITWKNIVTEQEGDTEMIEKKVLFSINGKDIKLDRILKEDCNYVKVSDLKDAGFDVSWDNARKISIINSPSPVLNNTELDLFGTAGCTIKTENRNGTLWVGLRELLEKMNFKVSWKNGKIMIK